MPDYPAEALSAAADAIRHEMRSSRDIDPEALARAALEAAAPILAEAWNLPALQAEHEEWQRRGVTARRIHDEFYAAIDARHPGVPREP